MYAGIHWRVGGEKRGEGAGEGGRGERRGEGRERAQSESDV